MRTDICHVAPIPWPGCPLWPWPILSAPALVTNLWDRGHTSSVGLLLTLEAPLISGAAVV